MGACIAFAVAAAFLSYRRQIFSYLTHWKGGPSSTWPYAPHSEPPPVHLAVVGDTGDSGTHVESTADTIDEIGRREPFDALLLLGDMIYPDGDPALLDMRVFEPFDGVLAEGTDLLAVLGNHDVSLEKGDEIMQRLGMPGRWWQRVIGDVTIIGLDSTRVDDPDQLAFLERSLEAADTTWTLVALHHPPYSSGYQGSSTEVRRAFSPLFERHGVQLVLSGHDHDYQRSEMINGVTYVVSGAGSGRRLTGTESFTEVAYAFVHFLDIAAYDDRIVVRAVASNGQIADEFELVPAGVP